MVESHYSAERSSASGRTVAPVTQGEARLFALVRSVPIWAWLTALVLASFVRLLGFVGGLPAPWIIPDELIYSEYARSFAESGRFAIRGVEHVGYGIVYPLLLAPVYAVVNDLSTAYAAVKVVNALLVSLAAVPAFLLARTVVGRRLSFVAAVLAVAVPSMVYSGVLMSENAFYPLFLLSAFAMIRALERPTTLRQVAVLALIGLAYLTRTQGIALLPGFASAIILVSALEARRDARGLRLHPLAKRLWAFRTTWGALALGCGLLVLVQASRGRSPAGLLGAYRSVLGDYSPADIPRWFLYHVAELDLYLGVLPFACLVVMTATVLKRSETSTQLRALIVLTVSLGFWMTLLVAAFSTQPGLAEHRVHERALFYVAPLIFIVSLAWVQRGLPRPRSISLVAVLLAVGLPAVLPYSELTYNARFEALALLMQWDVLFGLPWALAVMIPASIFACCFLVIPRRLPLLVPAAILLNALIITLLAQYAVQVMSRWTERNGSSANPTWIDDAVGSRANVVALYDDRFSPTAKYGIWENEFFNRSVGQVYYLGRRLPFNLPDTRVRADAATGRLRDDRGHAIDATYVLTASSTKLAGTVIARDSRNRMVLYRVTGPLRIGEAEAS